jgi:integrase
MAKQLTAAAVRRLPSGKKRREVRDGGCPGLRLVIQVSGHKSWALRFRRPSGKSAKLTLGPVDLTGGEVDDEPLIGMPLTLAAARRLAMDIHRERARGKDVVAVRHRERLERAVRGGNDFATAAIDYVTQYAMRKTRQWQNTARLLGLRPIADGGVELIPKGLADRWRDRPVGEINGDDIHGIIDETRERGTPGLERRAEGPREARAGVMFAALSGLFGWLIERRRVVQNPCSGVHRPAPPPARDRALTSAEVIQFWRATDAERKELGVLLKLLLLTGCRLNEVAGMRRAELSDDGATWTIPGERTKNRRSLVVALPPLARELIASIPATGEFVFSASGVIFGWSRLKHRLDAAMQIPQWRLHDLRRTFVTGLAELGIRPDVIELAVNHVSGSRGGIAGVYNKSELMAERRAALERWAAHVEGLVSGRPAKVLPLHKHASAEAVTWQRANDASGRPGATHQSCCRPPRHRSL